MKKSSIHHVGPISGLAAFSDKFVATAGYDNRLILWCAQTHSALACGQHDHLVNQCQFSPDGSLLVSASSDYTARIWSIPDMQLLGLIAIHADDVSKAAFSPDGRHIATSSFDGTLGLHDLQGGFKKRLVGHTGLIENFDWSPDSRLLHSCGMDGTIRTWDIKTGLCMDVKVFEDIDIDTLVLLDDGSCFAGNSDGTIACIDSFDNVELVDAHTTAVKLLFTDRSKTRLVSLGYDNKVHIWKIENGAIANKTHSANFPPCIWARSAAFLNETVIAFATFGSSYATWNITTGEWDVSHVETVPGINAVYASAGDVYSIGDSGILTTTNTEVFKAKTLCNFVAERDGKLFTGGQHGIIYDCHTGEKLYKHNAPLNCATFVCNENATYLAVGSYSGDVIYIDINRPTDSHKIKVHSGAIKGIACRKGVIATGTSDGEIKYTSADTFEQIHTIKNAHDGIVNDLCVFKNGFATVSRDLTLRLWEFKSPNPAIIRSSHKHSIKCVASNSAGDLIACGSYGGTVQIYDIERRAWAGKLFRPTMAGISSITWNQAANIFVAGSYDGNLYPILT